MIEYSDTHWEDLIATIIERIGVAKLVETIDYVLEQQGSRLRVTLHAQRKP